MPATNPSTTQSVQSMNTTLSSMGQTPLNMQSVSFGQDVDLRSADPRVNRQQQQQQPIGPSVGVSMDMDMRMIPNQITIPMAFDQRSGTTSGATRFPSDPRQRNDPRDPRQQKAQQSSSLAAQLHRGIQNDATDQEKAQLIMQVLKLTDEQIAILPPEQRASILTLKEQIAKNTNMK